jgi:hypothetical protein
LETQKTMNTQGISKQKEQVEISQSRLQIILHNHSVVSTIPSTEKQKESGLWTRWLRLESRPATHWQRSWLSYLISLKILFLTHTMGKYCYLCNWGVESMNKVVY